MVFRKDVIYFLLGLLIMFLTSNRIIAFIFFKLTIFVFYNLPQLATIEYSYFN